MALKLSVFTTATRPIDRGDNYSDAIECYAELADEVVIVNGDQDNHVMIDVSKFKIIDSPWPQEFNWPFIGEQFQRGYEACTGDWVIHADLDFVFHERDFAAIRKAMEDNPDAPALSFWKYQFILPDRYNLKSRLVVAVNKGKYGDSIRFDSGGDLCQPSLMGVEIKPSDVPEARVPFYNYEKIIKTKEQIQDDVSRMARAWHTHFKDGRLGLNDEDAYDKWLEMMEGRFEKPQEEIALADHPKYVQDTIKGLRPEHWGYDGHGRLPSNNYVNRG